MERLLLKKLVPLVAVLEVERHQPFGSSNATLVRLLLQENALFPMLVTLFGIVMLVRLRQEENAESAMPTVSERSETAVTLVSSQSIAHLPRYNTPFSQLEELL